MVGGHGLRVSAWSEVEVRCFANQGRDIDKLGDFFLNDRGEQHAGPIRPRTNGDLVVDDVEDPLDDQADSLISSAYTTTGTVSGRFVCASPSAANECRRAGVDSNS